MSNNKPKRTFTPALLAVGHIFRKPWPGSECAYASGCRYARPVARTTFMNAAADVAFETDASIASTGRRMRRNLTRPRAMPRLRATRRDTSSRPSLSTSAPSGLLQRQPWRCRERLLCWAASEGQIERSDCASIAAFGGPAWESFGLLHEDYVGVDPLNRLPQVDTGCRWHDRREACLSIYGGRSEFRYACIRPVLDRTATRAIRLHLPA